MRIAVVALLIGLAGCSGVDNVAYFDEVPMRTSGGPYGGDGTIHAIVVVTSFGLDGDPATGALGPHCTYDRWSAEPASLRMHVTPATYRPDATLVRMVMPGQDMTGVSSLGTSTYATGGGDIYAAFDPQHRLGSVSFDPPSFNGHAIPDDKWLGIQFHYESDVGKTAVRQTLYMRDFGAVPVEIHHGDHTCE